ncbi:hypothetical protein RR48_14711 [Papilio machaon]|uniref:Uncharacterized protein n=1 Tax=Papilio machaon TaxID=76193 RepID=A0A194QLM2_PAPMA|nr:hypothetical protein RR48_14711 [Papilio machaon]
MCGLRECDVNEIHALSRGWMLEVKGEGKNTSGISEAYLVSCSRKPQPRINAPQCKKTALQKSRYNAFDYDTAVTGAGGGQPAGSRQCETEKAAVVVFSTRGRAVMVAQRRRSGDVTLGN